MIKKIAFLMILFYTCMDSYGQEYNGIQGFWPNSQPGKKRISGPMYYQPPMYPVNDSTLGLDTAYMYNQLRFQTLEGRFNYLPTSLTTLETNKAYIMEFNTNKFLTLVDSVWDGSAYVVARGTGVGIGAMEFNRGVSNVGFGYLSNRSGTADYATGLGAVSLQLNTGTGVTGSGYAAGASNTGGYGTFNGFFSGNANSGAYVSGYGTYSLNKNIANNVSAFGAFSQEYGVGGNSVSIGYGTLQFNIGVNSTGIGFNALNYNNWVNRTAIGYAAGDSFHIGTVKNFASAVVSATVHEIYLPAHGLGTVGSRVNLRYDLITGTTIGGLTDDAIYQFTIPHADSLLLTNISSAGSGTYSLSKDIDKTASISIGVNSDNTRANQIMLGSATFIKEITGHGIWVMDSLKMPTGAGAGKYLISDINGIGTWQAVAAATFSTSVTSPLLIGGTGTTSTLTLQSTSGSGTTGSDIIFKDDNTEWARILNNGNMGIGAANPLGRLQISQDVAANSGTGVYAQLEITGFTNTAKRLAIGYNTTGNYGMIQAMTNAASFDNLILENGGGNVGIGNSSPTSKLHTTSFATAYRAITALRTLDATDNTVDCTSGTYTVTLPTAVGITGRIYTIVNSGTGVITVATTSSQNIAHATTYTLGSQDKYVTVQGTNAGWIVIANN